MKIRKSLRINIAVYYGIYSTEWDILFYTVKNNKAKLARNKIFTTPYIIWNNLLQYNKYITNKNSKRYGLIKLGDCLLVLFIKYI